MKQELKVILLNQYIGAIAIGYLIGRGFEAFFGAIMPVVNSILRQSLTGSREIHDVTLRQYVISNVILTGFYFLAAYLLALWLYSKPAETAEPVPTDSPV